MSLPNDQPIKEALAEEQATSLDDAMKDLGGNVAQMKNAATWWLESKADSLKVAVRRAAFKLLLVMIFLITAISAVVALVVVFISGIANGFTTLVGGRIWLGNLLTVAFIVGTVVIATKVISRRAQLARLNTLAEKYASKQPEHADWT